jgi:hypothetical protein
MPGEQIADDWVVLAGLLMGGAGLGAGTCVRLGGCRQLLRSYFMPELPAFVRHGMLAALPGGAFFTLGMLSVLAIEQYGEAALALAAVLMAGACIGLVLAVWVLISPPAWSKPSWLRTLERSGQPLPVEGVAALSPGRYLAGWAVLGVLTLGWLVLGLPIAPLAMGLGVGASVLIASRPGAGPPTDSLPDAERRAREARAHAEQFRHR